MSGKRRRLGELDLPERLSSRVPPIVTELVFGAACGAGAILVRHLVDLLAPTAGPYSLMYPAILLSTLFARWRAGLATFAVAFFYAWYVVLPEPNAFAFHDPTDRSRTVVNGVAGLVVLVLAEMFRRAVRRAVSERDEEIRARDLLLREIDHRMKNNFAIVASLLELQARTHDAEARDALLAAASRVRSLAAAHQSLYSRRGDILEVDMRDYLRTLTKQISDALLQREQVRLSLAVDDIRLSRDHAVAIGLLVNELVTNSVKHAFTDGQAGGISVELRAGEGGWRLTVSDTGRGMSAVSRNGGLGAQLLESFAAMAGGAIVSMGSNGGACTVVAEATAKARAG